MNSDELKRIANTGSFGSGKSARDKIHARKESLSILPDRFFMPELIASSEMGSMVPMCHFGNSSEDGKDWGIYHDGFDYCGAATLGIDARDDAKIIAAIVNLYRMGVLVEKIE